MRVASIAVGIVDYRDPRLVASSARLEFAAEDARAFHRYAVAAWPEPEHVHLLIVDAEATSSALDDAFSRIAASGTFDLFLLYLSGHGETDQQWGWFCLADADSGSPSLTGATLDRLLATLTADRTFLVADYCFAEASLSGSGFFGALGPDLARLFIASARRSQKAWEDGELKRSILSDVLLRSLASTSPLADRDGTVDAARLLPYLREQVPLEAASRKRGAIQEPVTGGTAAAEIRLPTVSASDIRRPLTIAQALRSRLRQILLVTAATTVAAWMILDLLIFHLAVAPDGAIEVRPGPAALYGFAPFHLGQRIDTGFTAADLSRRDPEAFRRLARGSERGFTTRKDKDRLGSWLARLESALLPAKRAQAAMLVRGRTPRLEQTSDPPPLEEAAFLATVSKEGRRSVADRIYAAPAPAGVHCGRPVAQQIDFGLLDIPSEIFARDLAWRAFRIDDRRFSGELNELVKPVAYRLLSATTSETAAADMEGLAAAAAMAKAPGGRLQRLTGWCEGAPASLLRALLGATPDRAAAEAALVADLPKGELPRGADWPREEALAIAALSALVQRSRVRPQTVEAIVSSFVSSGETLGNITALNRLLAITAEHQELPPSFRRRLLAVAREKADELQGIVAISLVARNWKHLQGPEIRATRIWLNVHGADNTMSSELHEALGNFSQIAPLRPVEIGWLADRLSPHSWLPPATTSLRGETVITVSDAEAAVALAKVGTKQRLPKEIANRLRTVAASRLDISDRDTLLGALAIASSRAGDTIAEDVIRDIRNAKGSALMRSLAVDTAAARLKAATPGVRDRSLDLLVRRWHRSRAPEERYALGSIIGKAASRG